MNAREERVDKKKRPVLLITGSIFAKTLKLVTLKVSFAASKYCHDLTEYDLSFHHSTRLDESSGSNHYYCGGSGGAGSAASEVAAPVAVDAAGVPSAPAWP